MGGATGWGISPSTVAGLWLTADRTNMAVEAPSRYALPCTATLFDWSTGRLCATAWPLRSRPGVSAVNRRYVREPQCQAPAAVSGAPPAQRRKLDDCHCG